MTLQEKQNKLNELYKPFFSNVKDKVGDEIGQYDFIIQNYLGAKKKDILEIAKENQLCEFELEGFENIKSFRTYHPGYLNRMGDLKNKIVEFLRTKIYK